MSCIVVVAPVIIAGWPVITAAITGAVGAMGFTLVQRATAPAPTGNRIEIAVEESEILHNSFDAEQIVVARDGIVGVFSRDGRGTLKLCIDSQERSKAELKAVGQELIDRVTQQYVYHRLITELKHRHMTILDEEVSADRTVKIRVRNP